jgi:hypothetical protein
MALPDVPIEVLPAAMGAVLLIMSGRLTLLAMLSQRPEDLSVRASIDTSATLRYESYIGAAEKFQVETARELVRERLDTQVGWLLLYAGTVVSTLAAIPIGGKVSLPWLLLVVAAAWRGSTELRTWWEKRSAQTWFDKMWFSWLERQVPDPLVQPASPSQDLYLIVMDCPHPDLESAMSKWPEEWKGYDSLDQPQAVREERMAWIDRWIVDRAQNCGYASGDAWRKWSEFVKRRAKNMQQRY